MKSFCIYIVSGLFLLVILGTACKSQTHSSMNDQEGQDKSHHAYTNELIHSSSPYLLQHAHNPVNWFPWGNKALEKAKKEDKLIIISVGYAACHWCHVMEHESFEDTTVAALMNDNFVSIKVDKEERPDIDQIYMNAAVLTSKKSGWPLNAIAMPDGRPLFAATYFAKDRWMKMLEYFVKIKAEDPEKLEEAAEQLIQGIQQFDMSEINPAEVNFEPAKLDGFFKQLIGQMDMRKGGLNKAPKFPMPSVHQWLLRYYYLTSDKDALKALQVSLDEMAAGGIYDQIGGGFARYSTDAIWKVPHFEKMLYDNAQLVSLYAEAYQATKNPLYKQIVEETLGFIERELTSPEGGFYTSLDADSEGEEGKFYIWTEKEIDDILGAESEAFKSYYNITPNGNWEGHNILFRTQEATVVAAKFGDTESAFLQKMEAAKQSLLKARGSRIRPGLDDKILTSWNALMLKGYTDAYRVLGEERYLKKAIRNAEFLKDNMLRKDGGLNRNFKSGKSNINAFSDDYSFTIEAFIALYQATFDESWLGEAKALMEYCIAHFYDEKSGMFYYTSDEDEALISRTKEIGDNVIPGANSSLAKGLFLLGTYLYEEDYIRKSEKMLHNVLPQMMEYPPYYSNWGILLANFTHKPYEVAIVGKNWKQLRAEMDDQFLPNVLFLGGNKEGDMELLKNKLVKGETFIYVCQDKACKFPVQDTEAALKLLELE